MRRSWFVPRPPSVLRGGSLLALLFLASCGSGARKYDASLFRLASGFSAKEVCSCVFVMQRDEAFCQEWTRVSPEVARFQVDQDKKEVQARALGMGRTLARYEDEQVGCVIVDD